MRVKLLVLFLFIFSILRSQNLVQNGDFEEYRKQSGYFLFNHLKYWYKPTLSSSDYQTSKYKWKFNNAKAFSGDAYIGLYLYMIDNDYCEYATNVLSEKLIKDSLYCLSLYVCLSEDVNASPKNLDVHFSSSRIKKFTKKSMANKYNADIKNIGNKFILNTIIWEKRSAVYKAKGGEKYMTIGLFSKDKIYQLLDPKKRKRNDIYLFIDLVSLTPISDSSSCQCYKRKISFVDIPELIESSADTIPFSKGDIIELSNIHFESNSYGLNDSTKQELNKLYHLLVQYPTLQVKINGHTDNIGKEKTNLRLSGLRAKAIVDYLIEKGVDKDRLAFEGYGEYTPLQPNTTKEGRSENRRVEFEIVE